MGLPVDMMDLYFYCMTGLGLTASFPPSPAIQDKSVLSRQFFPSDSMGGGNDGTTYRGRRVHFALIIL